MASGSGYGKVIVFGEHFVVHGNHSIVSAIAHKTTAVVEPGSGPGVELVDNRPATETYKKDKLEDQKKSVGFILEAMNIDPSTSLKITLAGDLYAASGVGASAASCTAMARALSEYFNMELSDEKINSVAFEGERGYHGKPSGVDNTASTYGGLMWYRKLDGKLEHKPIRVSKPIHIVMANCGITANTTAAVEKVACLKSNNPEEYARIAEDAEETAFKGKKAIEEHNLEEVGRLMDHNHELLGHAGVSTTLLDDMTAKARETGALGAKLTGGGMGGYMVALVNSEDEGKRVAEALRAMGGKITTLETTIG